MEASKENRPPPLDRIFERFRALPGIMRNPHYLEVLGSMKEA